MARVLSMRQLRLGLAQVNVTVGDFEGNTKIILETIEKARSLAVDLLAFPEMAVCGYPPEDLLFKPQFIAANLKSLDKIIEHSRGLTLVVGFVDAREDLYDAAAIIHNGKLVDVYHKIFLPNYGVFDEKRYFQEGRSVPVYTINGVGVGINICEDIWYEAGPATAQALAGAELIVNISSSPYYRGKGDYRERMLGTRAADNVVIVAYNNLVGGQDELVFDGNSLVLDQKGEVVARGKQFEEDLIVADLDIEAVFRNRLHDPRWRQESLLGGQRCDTRRVVVSEVAQLGAKPPLPAHKDSVLGFPAEVYNALVLGTRDYVNKNGFQKVVIGLSGGIDSGLTAVIAVDALGAENVTGLYMPSRYSSPGSLSDASLLAKNLGINLTTISIDNIFQKYLDTLAKPFAGTSPGVAEENIQARIRGNLLMALSNKFGWLVLTTGDKSEMATGFTTLYGDMAGGFAVIKDVPKTLCYTLAGHRNTIAGFELIPATVLSKSPSPELKADQKTADSLPPFPELDPVLLAYAEEDRSVEHIIATGYNAEMVKKVARMVDKSEYKRRQAPPGIKITPRAFGRDRRLPITSRFKEY